MTSRRWNLVAKRAFDLVCLLPLIVILAGPFLLLLLATRFMIAWGWHSPGPLFLLSHRIGKNGRVFTMLKLRTMSMDVGTGDRKWGDDLDTKDVGRWGRFLRNAKFDELPQLLNVLLGDMSLVGPRPEMPITHEAYGRHFVPFGRRVQDTYPGITGAAQLKMFTMRPEDVYRKYCLDMFYLRHQSLGYDLLILFRTAGLWIRLISEATREFFTPTGLVHAK